MADLAVLLMAYGTPRSENEVEEYLANIRKGRKPTREEIEELKGRYRRIGGHSPLLEITEAQASALEKALVLRGVQSRVFFGMKHGHPYVREIVPQIIHEGFERLVALVLAPHYSKMSTGGYQEALEKVIREGTSKPKLDFIPSWHDNPRFLEAVAEKTKAALLQFNTPGKAHVVFTAHSLPGRIAEENDPYPKQVLASCQAVAQIAKIERWSLAYQSAGQAREKWFGPHFPDVLAHLVGRDFDRNVLVVPIGFVSDHLEILYDIDVEAKDFARTHGLNLMRTESLNTSPSFISALADIVCSRLE